MELEFVLIVCLSAGIGLIVRRLVTRRIGRILLVVGVGCFLAAIGALGLLAVSQGHVLGMWSGAMVIFGLLLLAALVLPFAIIVSWRKPE
jgi:hypothetical protein